MYQTTIIPVIGKLVDILIKPWTDVHCPALAPLHCSIMAPKKTQTDSTNAEKSATTKTEETAQKSEEPKQDSNASKDKESKSTAKKRKAGAQSSDAPAKAQRRSGRSNTTSTSADDQIKLLNFLLSPSCLALTRPADEREYVESNGGDSKVRTYSASELTPLEELISAMILSRPIGRMRTLDPIWSSLAFCRSLRLDLQLILDILQID